MQNYDHYRHGIHTSGQASEKLRNCCSDFSYRFGLRVLMTFQGALLFILALQANTLISKAIDGTDDNVKFFDTTQFAIIMVFTFSVIILSYIKEYYVGRHHSQSTTFSRVPHDVETATHWAHGFYQK
jgi:hypothetical protein